VIDERERERPWVSGSSRKSIEKIGREWLSQANE
jgi:hypothetical protein